MNNLIQGIKCRACDKTLKEMDGDPELCGDCLLVVFNYNKDLDKSDKYYDDKDLDIEGMSLMEFELFILKTSHMRRH